MNIGERIRELRIAKLMTQADLAGDHITRNMLSCIENGSANPSLSTVLYIASRLGVPAGFLLAEAGDEIMYRKMSNLPNIKRAYTAGDLRGCRSLCVSACPEPDDEIALLLSSCDVGIAKEEFWSGRLRSACRFFDEALSYAEKTVYPTDGVLAEARVYFRYMERLSHTLYSDFLDEEEKDALSSVSPFSRYVSALDALDNGDCTQVSLYLEEMEEGSFFCEHIRIRLMMGEGNYSDSRASLLQLLGREEPLNKIELYTVLSELEICCRENDDFKGAYNYANEKIRLLEDLLKEY
ncbi:MAG: helix-turn-helix transcriptional regulator [Ruminococcaceae bacterium]|nr:helix-turn-helix transcriptional regulator [Oscillospiraceae bacterium]